MNCSIKKLGLYKPYIILSYVSQLLFSLIFSADMLYHVNVARLNLLQLVLVGTALEASIFLFEIPTGIVADTKKPEAFHRSRICVNGYRLCH